MTAFLIPPVLFLFCCLPAVVWISFWEQEDAHKAPFWLLTVSFVAGLIAVGVSIPAQSWAQQFISNQNTLLIVWAGIEELVKALIAVLFILTRPQVREPVDVVVYMLVIALGFAALENTLYLLDPIKEGQILYGLLSGHVRFIGATLVHMVSSAAIGVLLSFAFYQNMTRKILMFLPGLFLAILIHAGFNIAITHVSQEKIFFVLLVIWGLFAALIIVMEDVKRIVDNRFKPSTRTLL